MTAIIMGENEYRSLDRLNFSTFKYILHSTKKYLLQKENPWAGNDATRLGSAAHAWLQNDKDKVHFEPDLSGIKTKAGSDAKNPRNTTEGKGILAEFKKSLPAGAIIVPPDALEVLTGIEKSWQENDDVQRLREKITHIERTHIFTYDDLKFKARLDEEGDDFVTDLKSTSTDASRENVYSIIKSKHYDMQAATYLVGKSEETGIPILEIPYYMVFLETFAPYDTYVYQLSKAVITEGLRKLNTAIDLYRSQILAGEKIYNRLAVV
ncbi:PD-(D/E)XK nuclease-like domain-containing protein [Fluviispira vulneris]|uniref:PD-(D/E)XK nuclease-like domain-containing protein n=1 Tax=Fluviispira vulneris TaxID=2763012 RepID=UPI0016481910|nr:PD-(D/E)XK nuclease-like domain-containing protein [Fluviispira vulneris]